MKKKLFLTPIALLASLIPGVAGLQTAAAETTDNVKFNDGVRYSQWAINSRAYDFYGNTKSFGFDVYDVNGSLTSTTQWKSSSNKNTDKTFDYVAGLVGKAMLETANYYESFDWSKPWFYSAQAYATGVAYANSNMTLDNMNACKMYFPILSSTLVTDDNKTKIEGYISSLITDMKTYNTSYYIGSSNSSIKESTANDVQKKMIGGWFHKSEDYQDQMWCDGLYMGAALLAQVINYKNIATNVDSSSDWDLLTKQFTISWGQLYDSSKGLLYHAFTADPTRANSKYWDGVGNGVYHSAAFWGRADAWYMLALVDALEQMQLANLTTSTNYTTLKDYLGKLAAGLKNYQDANSGCWYQVLDEKDSSLSGNYLEGSCTSIFAAAFLKAIRLGLIDKATYEEVAKKAYQGAVAQFLVYDSSNNAKIQLINSCASAGLSGSNKRDGSRAYYITGSEVTKITSYTEGKILGGFIMAATEYERAYQGQSTDSKQILFSRDLAPTSTGTTALSVEVCGTDAATATYQWYKDSEAITDATAATYTPAANGSYKCTATANGASITTSEVTVTGITDGGSSEDKKDDTEDDTGETTTGTVYQYNTIGTTTFGNSEKVTTDSKTGYIKFGSNFDPTKSDKSSNYVCIKPASGSFKTGDVVTVTAYGGSSTNTLVIYTSTSNTTADFTTDALSNGSANAKAYTFTLTADCEALYLGRNGSNSVYITALTVTRSSSSDSGADATPATSTYAISSSDATKAQTSYTTADKNLTVTLGGWMFADKTVSNGTTDETLASVDWGGVGTASDKPFGYGYYVQEGDTKNARQEDGSNAQPMSTKAYDSKIAEVTGVTISDKMFNVPASGSFLVFNAKTNGTVKASIYQDGIFDSSDNTTVYRPQRRVFVVDEAGSFVSTSAEAASGQMFGCSGDISDYTWDLNNDQAPTVDNVKSHLKNLTTFEFSTSQANGVYESNLGNDIVHNEVLNNEDTKALTGASGWCMLSDGAATYTFNVKAGKTYYLYNYGSRIGLYGFSFTPAANVQVDELTFNDNQTNTITETAEGHVAQVTLNKTVKQGIWNACVLPFSLNKQQVDAIFGETYSNSCTDGTQILYFDHIGKDASTGKDVIYFVRHAYNTIVAGKPFLIKPTKSVTSINTADVTDYPYVTIESTSPDDWCSSDDFAWVSSYSNDMTVNTGDYYIGSTSGSIIKRTAAAVGINGFRGFLQAKTTEAKAKVMSMGTSSNTGDDDSTTAIYGIVMDTDGKAQSMPTDGKVYSLNGQCVATDASQLSSLPCGIYIVNRVKIVK